MVRSSCLQRLASLVILVASGCGAKVVFDDDTHAGAGGSGGVAPAGGNSPTTGSTGGVPSTSSSSTGSLQSTSTGPSDPCLGLPCGETCIVCNDFECVDGFCDGNGVCDPVAVGCRTHQLCYTPDRGARCAPAGEEAEPLLCEGCGGGKGCTFFGLVVQGPFVEDGSCCYQVTGDCLPNP